VWHPAGRGMAIFRDDAIPTPETLHNTDAAPVFIAPVFTAPSLLPRAIAQTRRMWRSSHGLKRTAPKTLV